MKIRYLLFLALATTGLQAQYNFLNPPADNTIRSSGNVVPITASIGFQGYEESQQYFGQGEYEIFLDNVDGVLDLPIIVLDGFDPGDGRDINSLYNTLSFDGQNLADLLRDEGFDIVILNAPQYSTDGNSIDGGSDYIQRNAFVLVELIQEINTQKVGDEELVVLGPSMGGLIARYALSYMEQNALDPNTRLYISFDSPHLGAHIPISLQYLINYLAQEGGNATAQAIVDEVLNSPAAREMLIDHYLAHLLAGSTFEQDPAKLLPEGAPGFRDAFQAELDALGFPQNVRNVSMINGDGQGNGTGTPGMLVIDTNLNINTLTSTDLFLRFAPEASQTNTVTGIETFFLGIPVAIYSADAESPAESDGLDSAPGGMGSISGSLGGGTGNPVLDDFINALEQDQYNFIPTLSALAISSEPNWYTVVDTGDSPFVNTYIPPNNEPHVTVTSESAQWALDEILQPILSNSNISSKVGFLLEENPVSDEIRVRRIGEMPESELTLEIFSLSGVSVYAETIVNPSQLIRLPNNLRAGIYLLKIATDQGIQHIKFLAR